METSKIHVWPMYSLLGVLIVMLAGLGGFIYKNSLSSKDAVAGDFSHSTTTFPATDSKISSDTPWEVIYPNTKELKINETIVKASIARSWPERIKGLSDTPYLPKDVVKLFNFDSPGFHSIWMKDMNYSLDIIWVDENSKIVHIEKGAAPESYPAMFVTDVPATYVIEASSGFVDENNVAVGDLVVLPKL